MHSLLRRQLRRNIGNPDSLPGEWQALIELVSNAYDQFDADRAMLERPLDLSSKELIQANSEMRAVFERVIASIDGIFAYNRISLHGLESGDGADYRRYSGSGDESTSFRNLPAVEENGG